MYDQYVIMLQRRLYELPLFNIIGCIIIVCVFWGTLHNNSSLFNLSQLEFSSDLS